MAFVTFFIQIVSEEVCLHRFESNTLFYVVLCRVWIGTMCVYKKQKQTVRIYQHVVK